MSKFLKFLVNLFLICVIVVAAGLLIPPFAGVTTVVVDDVNMNTNLAHGSVTYAYPVETNTLKQGDQVVIRDIYGSYVYRVSEVGEEEINLVDTRSVDQQSRQFSLSGTLDKLVFTVPYIGYVSMAMQTTEGLIIIGLCIVFLIILFILSEIWKGEEREEEESSVEKQDEAAEVAEAEQQTVDQNNIPDESQKGTYEGGRDILQETQDALAADIGQLMEQDAGKMSMDEKTIEDIDITKEVAIAEESIQEEQELVSEEEPIEVVESKEEEKQEEDWDEPKKLAIPVYTKEELLYKATVAGEDPKVLDDELNGITILDYSDLL